MRVKYLVLLIGLVVLFPNQLVAQEAKTGETVRFATFNISFHRRSEGQLAEELEKAKTRKPKQIAEIIQRVNPDVILLNEFDYDKDGVGMAHFLKNHLGVGQNGQKPVKYPYSFSAPVNTGVATEHDLNDDGEIKLPNDAYGFGWYPGQYGMVVLSKYEIDKEHIRTFQKFLWKDMPGNLLPIDPGTDEPYYDDAETKVFRLSSKSHWDVPIKIGERTVHFLAAHPTPPVFDDIEDRNGRRNFDEIRLFADYVQPEKSAYIYDDRGSKGGLKSGDHFVIVGDMNADSFDGDSTNNAAHLLTKHPLISQELTPKSEGGVFYAKSQGRKNLQHQGDPAFDTGDFSDANVGNLRLDYCLPSKTLSIQASGVFWPKPGQPGADLVKASDHRLVWIDVKK